MVKRSAVDLESEAAQWFVRWSDQTEAAGSKEQSRWLAWLQRSPRHVAAYFAMDDMSARLSESRAVKDFDVEQWLATRRAPVVRMSEDCAQRQTLEAPARDEQHKNSAVISRRNRLRSSSLWKIAASVAVMAVGALSFWHFTLNDDSYRTGVGEQEIVRLSDGSVLQLNTQSQARVSYTAGVREIELEGEALFTVAKDLRRPFLVRTHDATVRAIGTRFNVYEQGNATRVAVLEGRVSVTSEVPSASFELGAGEEAEVTKAAARKEPRPNVKVATAWQNRTLVFERAKLAEVAREFNRYNTLQFQVDPAMGEVKRLSGTFDARHPESLLLWLQSRQDIAVSQRGDVYNVREAAVTSSP